MCLLIDKFMAKWSTISGRFNEDEKKLIEKWQKRVGRSDNQMVRDGVATMIGFVSMADILLRPDFEPLRGFFNQISTMMSSPQSKKNMEKAFEEWSSIYKKGQMKDLDSKLKVIEHELKVFDSHPKRGRQPKKQKRAKPNSS